MSSLRWFFIQDENGLEGWFKMGLVLGAVVSVASAMFLVALLADAI